MSLFSLLFIQEEKSSFLPLQFPVKSMQHHEKTAADHLGLNYVTERILASVLPNRNETTSVQQQQQQLRHLHDTEFSSNGRPHSGCPSIDELPQDIYEQELISMLEQKHGKVPTNTTFFACCIRLSCCGDEKIYHFSFGRSFFFSRSVQALFLARWLTSAPKLAWNEIA